MNITFFGKKVEEETYKLPPGILAEFFAYSRTDRKIGADLGSPHTKALGRGLFEIRAKDREGIGRSLFCLALKNEIIILLSFIKETQKTPKKEIETALKRMKEIK